MSISYLVFGLIIFLTLAVSVRMQKLTGNGALAASVIGCFIFMGTGIAGIALVGTFFALGNLATSWKINDKPLPGGPGQARDGRTAGQVFANGGMAGLLGLTAFFLPTTHPISLLLMASCLSAATADTLSSELGMVYGKRFYNILGFGPGIRGENGVVSLEGFVIGIMGSAMVSAIYGFATGWESGCWYIIVAGSVGNLADSLLGATLERRGSLNNNSVNLLNTIAGAVSAYLLRITLG